MAINDERRAQILRYHFVEHWRVGTIARQLGVHHSTVERVLGEAGVERERQRQRRPSKLDPYIAFITETLERFPTLTAARLFDMVKARGYPGGPDHFRHRIAQLRPRRPREAYLRLRTLAGEQAQVDWAHFGKLTIGRAERPLMAFVLVLSYSRYPFVRFSLGASLAHLIRGHVEAFSALGGTAKGPALRQHEKRRARAPRRTPAGSIPRCLELAAHYHFEPRPVAPARGNEKGRVERLIRFCPLKLLRRASIPRPRRPQRPGRRVVLHPRRRAPLSRGPPTHRRRGVRRGAPPPHRAPRQPLPLRGARRGHRRQDPLCAVRRERLLDSSPLRGTHPRRLGHPRHRAHPRRRHRARHPSALVRPRPANRRPHPHRDAGALQAPRPRTPRHRPPPPCRPLSEGPVRPPPPSATTTSGSSPADSSRCSTPTDPPPSNAPSPPLSNPMPHTSGGCVTSSTSTARNPTNHPPLALDLPDDPRLRSLSVRPHDLADYDRLNDESKLRRQGQTP